ncbi:MAG: DUF5668 domain-containing protein [Patescibacteria group bacterium]
MKKTGGMSIFNDWFYLLLLVLVGFILLGTNLGFLSMQVLVYWPVLLIVIALKELLDRH